MNLDVLFTPADFDALRDRDLAATVCVVFDVLRATSSMITALGNGAAAILPVSEIAEAVALRQQHPEWLLAGERQGLRIGPDLANGSTFDFGNSPREFTRQAVAGRTLVVTTTNGTRALRACGRAQQVLVGSFLNLAATVDAIGRVAPANLLVVCSGTHDQAAYEDVLAAGALCDRLWRASGGLIGDGALMARQLRLDAGPDLLAAMSRARNARRLLEQPALREDVAFCARQDVMPLAVEMRGDGRVIVQ